MDMRYFTILLALLSTNLSNAAAAPTVSGIQTGRADTVTIKGQGFGQSCRDCEIIADFGGFKYAFPVERWSDRQIVAKIADIGKGDKAKIVVKTPGGDSKPLNFRIPSKIVPQRKLNRPVKAGSVPDLLMFEHRSNLSVGDKGEERYDVSSPAPACGQTGYVFDSANLVIGRDTRFGEAKIVGMPKAGCQRCQPIRVRWYHEPTGKLHYQVHVYRRLVEGICPALVRR